MSNKIVEDAIRVASKHYEELVRGNREEWLKTIVSSIRRQADVRGSSIDFWWRTGRKLAEKGVTYKFQRVDRIEKDRVKLFFLRVDKSGKQMGMPVPIHLVREDNKWWVNQPSY